MKMKTFFQKLKHLFILGAIVLAAVFCMVWVGYDTVRESVGLGHRQIVNDDYSVLTEAIGTEGITQPITVKADTDFYGVNLNMHTFDRVVFGRIFMELQDTEGNVLAVVQDDMTNIKDNIFMRFDFDGQNFKSEEDRDYILRIYTEPQTKEDKVAMWKSEATVDGYGLMTENGTETEGTLALQYIVKYVTDSIWTYYFILCVLMLLLLVGGYLLIFVKKVKVSTAFVFLAAVLGFIFSLYTPVKGAPDEYVHITSAYSKSNTLFGYKYGGYYEGSLLMRESDVTDWINPVNYNAFELHDYFENFEKDAEKTENLVYINTGKADVFPPLYWAQTLGVHLARILGVSFSMLILMGRLSNLVLYIVLVYFAIRRMPFFKTTLAAVALTPVPMQLAASFNYDTLVIGLCFLFTATVFDLAYSREKVTVKDTVLLTVLAAFIAPSKTIYILVVALAAIIPFEKFGGKKKALINLAVVAAAAVVMWLAYNQSVISMVKDNLAPLTGITSEEKIDREEAERRQAEKDEYYKSISAEFIELGLESNNTEEAPKAEIEYRDQRDLADSDQYFTLGYILTHIPQTVKLLINTVQELGELYIRQIFGGIFGEVIVSPVKLNWIYTFAVIMILFMTTLLPQGETLQYTGARKWWALAIALAVAMLVIAVGIVWTPVNYVLIYGVQGRYILPVLPLILLFFTNGNITVKKKLDGVLLFAICAVNVLMLLDGLTIMLANTRVYY